MSKEWGGGWKQPSKDYRGYSEFIHKEFRDKLWDKMLAPTKRKQRTVIEIEWDDNTKSIHADYNHLGGLCDDCSIDNEKPGRKIIRYRTITI